MPSKRTPATKKRAAQKHPPNPKQAAELFQEGQRILAARSTAAIADARASDTGSSQATAAAQPAAAAGKPLPSRFDGLQEKIARIMAGPYEDAKEVLLGTVDIALRHPAAEGVAATAIRATTSGGTASKAKEPTAANLNGIYENVARILASNDAEVKQALFSTVDAYMECITDEQSGAAPGEASLLERRIPSGEKLTPEMASTLRGALISYIMRHVTELDWLDNIQRVAQFVHVVSNYGGCTTPAQTFLVDMVDAHYRYGGLTPEIVARQLDPENTDGFSMNFEEQLENAKGFLHRYPRLMAQPLA
jgi:hypothetical protein